MTVMCEDVRRVGRAHIVNLIRIAQQLVSALEILQAHVSFTEDQDHELTDQRKRSRSAPCSNRHL